MTELEELKRVVEHANDGQWLPFALIGGMVAVISFVSFSYVKLLQKNNTKLHSDSDERHEDHEKSIIVLIENQTDLKILSAKYDIKIEGQQGQINELRRKVG